MTNELPLCGGSQQLPQQLIDCGAWMMPRSLMENVVSLHTVVGLRIHSNSGFVCIVTLILSFSRSIKNMIFFLFSAINCINSYTIPNTFTSVYMLHLLLVLIKYKCNTTLIICGPYGEQIPLGTFRNPVAGNLVCITRPKLILINIKHQYQIQFYIICRK